MQNDFLLNRQTLTEISEGFERQKRMCQTLNSELNRARRFSDSGNDYDFRNLERQIESLSEFFRGLQQATESIIEEGDYLSDTIRKRIEESIDNQTRLFDRLDLF